MALPEHLKIVKAGVGYWNEWKSKNIHLKFDLSDADLSNLNLSGIDFSDTDLSGADLKYANLFNANLIQTNLSSADLTNVNLIGVNLTDANVENAKLNNADLSRAKLSGVNLSGAELVNANLTDAFLQNADLTDANLIGANLSRSMFDNANLDNTTFGETLFANTVLVNIKKAGTCRHESPSTLDYRTIIKSIKLPKKFLQGCGMSNPLIDCYSKILNSKDVFHSCFISFSSKDEPLAEKLYSDLSKRGVPCWFAPKDMKAGFKIRSTIVENIKRYDKLLLILSRNSIRSSWVEYEVENAFAKELETHSEVLCPIRIDNSIMKKGNSWATNIRELRHIADFTNWMDTKFYKISFGHLLNDIRVTPELNKK